MSSPAWWSIPPSSASPSTSAAASPRATRSRGSSAASPIASRLGSPQRSSATRKPTHGSALAVTLAASSPPTALKRRSGFGGFFGFRGGRPGEFEAEDRLAAVFAPGFPAEGADRVERDRAFVFGAAEQVGPGGRRHLVGHRLVWEEQ